MPTSLLRGRSATDPKPRKRAKGGVDQELRTPKSHDGNYAGPRLPTAPRGGRSLSQAVAGRKPIRLPRLKSFSQLPLQSTDGQAPLKGCPTHGTGAWLPPERVPLCQSHPILRRDGYRPRVSPKYLLDSADHRPSIHRLHPCRPPKRRPG